MSGLRAALGTSLTFRPRCFLPDISISSGSKVMPTACVPFPPSSLPSPCPSCHSRRVGDEEGRRLEADLTRSAGGGRVRTIVKKLSGASSLSEDELLDGVAGLSLS
jgi:hypothetical protein